MYPWDSQDLVGFGPRMRFKDVIRAYPTVVTPPAIPAGWLESCKAHARITTEHENTLIQDYMRAAIEGVENDAEMALLSQTRQLYLDFLPAWEIELRCPPVTAVNSVTYQDFNNVTQTIDPANYRVDLNARPAIITPAYGLVWIWPIPEINAVNVNFTCGYAAADLVPISAKLAVYLKTASIYWDREMSAQEEQSYWRLIDKIRWRKF